MTRSRSHAAARHLLLLASLLFPCWRALASPLPPPQSPSAAPAPSAVTRPCASNPVLVLDPKSKSSKKLKHPLPAEPPPVCIEVQGEALELQEFLQNTVRELQWRISDNLASEDSWSFVRYLNAEEVTKYADTKVLLEPVDFTSGKVSITVRTSDAGDGFVRMQIATHFQGEGKSTEKVMGQPGTVWPLNSKGVLERELITAIQTRFKHIS